MNPNDPINLPAEQRMEAVLATAYCGIYHLPSDITKTPHYWSVNVNSGMATFDFDELTVLVLAAHEYGVRVQISQAGPRMVKLMLHPRKGRSSLEPMSKRHPTIEEAIENYKARAERYRPKQEPVQP